MAKKLVRAGFLLLSLTMLAAQGPTFPYSVVFTWTLSPTAGVTGQNIYRAPYSAGACGTYIVLTTAQLGPTITSYTDTTVVPGAQYCYEATALVGTAESGPVLNSTNPVSLPPAPQTALTGIVK